MSLPASYRYAFSFLFTKAELEAEDRRASGTDPGFPEGQAIKPELFNTEFNHFNDTENPASTTSRHRNSAYENEFENAHG